MSNKLLFAEAQKARQIDTTLLMATSFRTGSTLLGRLLEIQTGLAFQTEAFNSVSTWYSKSESDLRAEFKKLFSPVRSNIFAAKIMWPQRNSLAAFLGIDESDFSAFQHIFPKPKFFCLFRRDKIAQAVSFHIARHTNAWDSRKTATSPVKAVPYSFSTINAYYMHFLSFELLWRSFIEQQTSDYHCIYYEDLVQDPKSIVKTILNQLNLEFYENKWSDQLPLSQQRGDLSQSITERFQEDLHTYSPEMFLPTRLLVK